MTLFRHFLFIFAFALCFDSFAYAAPNELAMGSAQDEEAVAAQTRKVIGFLDAGEMGQAWDGAAKPFQDLTSRIAFVATIKSMRALAGDVKTRSLRGIGFTRALENAPPGFYAGVFFETTFANASAVEEKLIFINQNGQWRLAGYFLKKTRPSSGGASK